MEDPSANADLFPDRDLHISTLVLWLDVIYSIFPWRAWCGGVPARLFVFGRAETLDVSHALLRFTALGHEDVKEISMAEGR